MSACLSTHSMEMCLLFFATCSHSFSFAPTRRLKLHLEPRPPERQMKSTHFSSQIRCSHGSHEPSTMDLILSHSFALSLLIFFYVEQSAASQTKLQSTPRCLLELESFGWHVGGRVEAISSTLDGLWDQGVVFLDLKPRHTHTTMLELVSLRCTRHSGLIRF